MTWDAFTFTTEPIPPVPQGPDQCFPPLGSVCLPRIAYSTVQLSHSGIRKTKAHQEEGGMTI